MQYKSRAIHYEHNKNTSNNNNSHTTSTAATTTTATCNKQTSIQLRPCHLHPSLSDPAHVPGMCAMHVSPCVCVCVWKFNLKSEFYRFCENWIGYIYKRSVGLQQYIWIRFAVHVCDIYIQCAGICSIYTHSQQGTKEKILSELHFGTQVWGD